MRANHSVMELQKEIREKEQHFHVVLGSSGALGIILYNGELKLEGVCCESTSLARIPPELPVWES